MYCHHCLYDWFLLFSLFPQCRTLRQWFGPEYIGKSGGFWLLLLTSSVPSNSSVRVGERGGCGREKWGKRGI